MLSLLPAPTPNTQVAGRAISPKIIFLLTPQHPWSGGVAGVGSWMFPDMSRAFLPVCFWGTAELFLQRKTRRQRHVSKPLGLRQRIQQDHVQESTAGKATGRRGPDDAASRDSRPTAGTSSASRRVTLRPWRLSAEEPAPFAPETRFPAAFQVDAWHKQGLIPVRSLL